MPDGTYGGVRGRMGNQSPCSYSIVRKERARISVWSQRQDETKREHADETERQDETKTECAEETDRKMKAQMNPNTPWARQKENIYIIHLINNIFKT